LNPCSIPPEARPANSGNDLLRPRRGYTRPTSSTPPTPARAPVVALTDVRKRFDSAGPAALDGITVTVPEGHALVLLGTSGSGKTTALKTMNGLVTADHGEVRVLGEDVTRADVVALRRRIGYVIQEGGLLPHLSVLDNVVLVPRLLGWPLAERVERGLELLRLVRLDADLVRGRRPADLSGGERQRVGVARALAARPPLLLMDEPFGALDALTRRRMQDDFRELQARLGVTVVLVTHDVPEALRLADEIAVLDRGRIVQQGTPKEIRDAPRAGFVEQLLAAALPDRP
jgi:osmoprotectant transport system ATP-binding protein